MIFLAVSGHEFIHPMSAFILHLQRRSNQFYKMGIIELLQKIASAYMINT